MKKKDQYEIMNCSLSRIGKRAIIGKSNFLVRKEGGEGAKIKKKKLLIKLLIVTDYPFGAHP